MMPLVMRWLALNRRSWVLSRDALMEGVRLWRWVEAKFVTNLKVSNLFSWMGAARRLGSFASMEERR